MNIVIINGNPLESEFNIALSEIIYSLESNNIDVRNIVLSNFEYTITDMNRLKTIINDSYMVIYASPIVENFISKKLLTFLSNFNSISHPSIFVILECNEDITIESINKIIDYFERFSKIHNSKIIDVQYISDAKDVLTELLCK